MLAAFAGALLNWYQSQQRSLPWRSSSDPYQIWVSEVMLQQTRVETVLPYYARWLERFPTVDSLAAASQQEALAMWEGLGYYSRARNLHRAAQKVVKEFGGRIPSTVAELRMLPGIGAYTAAAIASIAFGVDVAVLDGNVKRVLARLFNYSGDVKSARGEKELSMLAQRLLPPGQAGDYNQALMELGATICTPRTPACPRCPVREWCQAQQLGLQHARPVTRKRAPAPRRVFAVGVIRKRGRVLLTQRADDGLLGGLWAFPSVSLIEAETGASSGAPSNAALDLQRGLRQSLGVCISVQAPLQTLSHAYTHFRVTAYVFDCDWLAGQPQGQLRVKWLPVSWLVRYPMGKIDRSIARHLARTHAAYAPHPGL
ncbi:MAG: A/G-specific adenine glycosylase [Anaerolineales bacterium]|nr:A/G-specific adenine glycosylase [Anaerolineales bacterium]